MNASRSLPLMAGEMIMKKLYVGLTALALLASTSVAMAQQAPAESQSPAFKAHVLTRAEFDALLQKPSKVLIVDVRRPDELTNIGGFPVYLSVQLADLEQRVDWIPKDRTIVTVSNHAARGGRAADLLTSKGFKVAGTIGAQNYEEQGGLLTKIAPRERKAADVKVKLTGSAEVPAHKPGEIRAQLKP